MGPRPYKAALRERATFLRAEAGRRRPVSEPVLVRELSGEFDPQNANHRLQQEERGAAGAGEQAVSDGRRMSDESVQRSRPKIENVGEDSTLAQAIRGPATGRSHRRLIPRQGDLAAGTRRAGDERGLTPLGKDRIAKMLVGRLFETPAQFKAAPPALRNNSRARGAARSTPGRAPEWSVTPQIREAVGILQEMPEHGGRNVATW